VLINLLNNAYDAVADCETKEITLTCEVQDGNLAIKVIDSGSGVPENIREKIMEPFFTTKDIGKGTGLGLSISASIIDDHGGTFQLETSSKLTTFVITLPLSKDEKAA